MLDKDLKDTIYNRVIAFDITQALVCPASSLVFQAQNYTVEFTRNGDSRCLVVGNPVIEDLYHTQFSVLNLPYRELVFNSLKDVYITSDRYFSTQVANLIASGDLEFTPDILCTVSSYMSVCKEYLIQLKCLSTFKDECLAFADFPKRTACYVDLILQKLDNREKGSELLKLLDYLKTFFVSEEDLK